MKIEKIRQDFPILKKRVNGKGLIYLDNAATTQKPNLVINALTDYYENYNANIHRGVHKLSEIATEQHETARKKTADFIGAKSAREIIFTRNATESLNMVAYSYGTKLKKGDNIVCTVMEHHSNIVPWQMMCERKGAVLRVIPINDNGEIIFEEFLKILSPKAWKVLIHICGNPIGSDLSTRSSISRAALSVKVRARISDGSVKPSVINRFILSVITVVLPVPAPAIIKSGPSP